ncbi:MULTISPECIES: hypothetical protein [unclassified Parafrankia]|uniref:hypothetical protein n=1 Tax=unclassified Parafrankia TaxID=2994368 RepID=UPI000DA5834C|nr:MULTISPECIES: hypothetical protein [unclassified Parafrankia]TCJ35402.1 hypothetical protein E0504_28220 [Parafrankia sp. BMG5.11]SQD98682.1 conserved hypothetical protein [Parafrankia sp. Ea1.12]
MAADDVRVDGPGPSSRQPPGVTASAAVAGLLALVFLALALAVPDPSRHAHGLLVVVDLVAVAGVGAVWIRVVRLVGLSVDRRRVE